jgi:ubiquinone/menaquinone biosynthesis C-methylase UbiE
MKNMWRKVLYNNFPSLARFYRKQEYELLSRLARQNGVDLSFINYGYAGGKYSNGELKLSNGEENNKYSIQLYDHVISEAEIRGKRVLEVGSGRGGGANFIVHRYHPKMYVGVDLANNAVEFCKRKYENGKLKFYQGNAEDLQFDDNSFDVIINLESSHCYPRVENFFGEVKRLLKPNGTFLIADWRVKDKVDLMKDRIISTGLRLKKEEDISSNVLESLELDHERKKLLVEKLPGFIKKPFSEFAGLKGYGLYDDLFSGRIAYMNYAFVNAS